MTITVELDTADDLTFSMAAGDVEMIETFLGFRQPLDAVAAASSCRVVLSNAGALITALVGGTLDVGHGLRLRSGAAVLWRGMVDRIEMTTGGAGRQRAIITGVQHGAALRNSRVTLPVAFNQAAPALLDEIFSRVVWRLDGLEQYLIVDKTDSLCDVAWAAPTSVGITADAGLSTFVYSGEGWGDGVLAAEAARQVVESEAGRLFWSRDNECYFYNRHHLLNDNTTDYTITDPYGLQYSYEAGANHVEIRVRPRETGTTMVLAEHPDPIRLGYGETKRVTLAYRDSMGERCGASVVYTGVAGSEYSVNTESDGSGTDLTSPDYVRTIENGLTATQLELANPYAGTVYVIGLHVDGIPLSFGAPAVTMVDDEVRQTHYGHRLLELDLPIFATQAEVNDRAGWEVGRRAAARGYLREMVLHEGMHAATMAALTLFDRVAVSNTQTGHSDEYWVISEAHEATAAGGWRTRYGLELARDRAFRADISLADGEDVAVY